MNLTLENPNQAECLPCLKINELWSLVGNTPMIALDFRLKGSKGTVYIKCEHYNLTGSIKDRMALYTIQRAYETGKVKVGDTIVEATSGNTGIAFAAIGKSMGHKVRIIMPDWLSKERVDIIRSLGAEITLVRKDEGGFLRSIQMAEEMGTADPNVFLPRQFDNLYNLEAHQKTTGPEILKQLESQGRRVDAFVAGVGTGGTVAGVGRYLKAIRPITKVHPMEPAESPTLTTGYKVGSHRIQGISDEFIPSIVKQEEMDEVIQVNDGDAILMAQKLASTLGLAVGISSGANLIAAIKQQQKLGGEATVVTVFADSNKKYLSTDLVKAEPVREGYLSPEIELIGFKPIARTK